MKKLVVILLIFITLIVYIQKISPYQNVASEGDYISILDPAKTLVSNFFVYRSNINNGYVDNAASLLGINSSYLLYEYIFSSLGINQLVRTYLLISLIYFCSFFNMYVYLKQKQYFEKDSKLRLLLIPALYSFSPYFINFFAPGHFLFLILPALFPLIQLLFEKIITDSGHDIYAALRYAALMTLLIAFICAPFSNVGVLSVFYALMIGQLILHFIFKKINQKQFAISFFLISITIFISNIWWLAPYATTMGDISAMGEQSRVTIGGSIGTATINSSLINIITGFPEGTAGNPLFTVLQTIFLSLLLLSFISAQKKKLSTTIIPIFIIIITIFFTKGPNPPFGNVFDFLYEKILILQIIRRPASKLYWIIIFFSITSFAAILGKNQKKLLSVLINALLILSLTISCYATVSGIKLTPFNIPQSYYQANQYLLNDGVSKILLLPDLGGLHPEYNAQLNYHKGIDFLGQIWEFKKYIPSSTFWTIEDSERVIVNTMAKNIYEGKNFCDLSEALNISHIVIRKDLLSTNYNAELLYLADSGLRQSEDITNIKEFGSNFVIYQIAKKCNSKLISTTGDGLVTYKKINSTKFELAISTSSAQINLIFREKNDNGWILHDGSLNSLVKHKFTKLREEGLSNLSYANLWNINLAEFCSENTSKCKAKDGTYETKLYIEYQPQIVHYIALSFSTASLLLCIIYVTTYQYKLKRKT